MKTLNLHEFARHLEKSHLKTQYVYMPNGDRVPPEFAWGWITNELITRGASFQAVATFRHPKGLPERSDIQPFFAGKTLLDHVGFHLLDEAGEDADMEEVCARVINLRPDLMKFDADIIETDSADWVKIDRDDHRTYCLQAAGRPDLVFDGVILEWDYVLDEHPVHSVRSERTKYRTVNGRYVASRDHATFEGGRRLLIHRAHRVFPTEKEADEFLYSPSLAEEPI
ncbi:MAG: hypothetical protein ACU0B9_11060 [Limimaricola soesokkakensis]|uniref:hypothetical protein n=1 Tax=Limimaricola soesokkakensis TaxID=1343159 RepID=UPI004057FFF5